MTASSNSVSKADLHAFVDGQLDKHRQRVVAEYLATHPEAAERVAAYQAQNTALQALFNPVITERLPRAMRPPRGSRRLVHFFWAAASFVLLITGGVLGWHARELMRAGVMQETAVARQAAVAHSVFTPQRRHPVEVTGDEETHLVAWLSKVLGAPLRAPRLTELGYALVGGRLLSATNGPAAQFMYEDSDGHRITLYVVTNRRWRGRTEFRYAVEGTVSIFYWIEGPVGYALSAEMARPKLLKVARAVYAQLKP